MSLHLIPSPSADPFDANAWSQQLRLNAACCTLGRAIYQASCEVYAPDAVPFEQLEPRHKDKYIALAKHVLGSQAPPVDAPDLVDHLFQLGVALNRAAGAALAALDDEADPDLCLFCLERPATSEHHPYCSATCGIDAENDR